MRYSLSLMAWLVCVLLLAMPIHADSIGSYTQNTNVELYQTCNNCTYCNITNVKIKSPIKIDLISDMRKMSNIGTYYNFSLDKGNTSTIGTYEYCYDCGNDNERSTGCLEFQVTSTGTILSIPQSMMYFIFLLASIGIFILCLYYAVKIPWKNQRDEDNYVIQVNDLKYVKLFLMCMVYILLMFISGLLFGITSNFLPEIGVYRFFEWLYWLLLGMIYPVMIGSLLFALIIWISNKKFQEAIARGIPIQ